jgi:uncharacterized membrane protein YcfT
MSGRIDWLDIAKGGSVVLVVYHHSFVALGSAGLDHAVHAVLDTGLRQIRLPLFFFCAGLTTWFLLRKPLPEYALRRCLPLLWIFVVWTTIYSLLNNNGLNLHPDRYRDIHLNFLDAMSNMWFIWVLAALTMIVWPLQKLPRAPVVLGAFFLAIAANLGWIPLDRTPIDSYDFRNTIWFAPFFLLGALFAPEMFRFLDHRRSVLLLFGVSLAAFVSVNVCALLFDLGVEFQTLRYALGAALGLSTAVLIARLSFAQKLLGWFGARSLTVFVNHQIIIACVFLLIPAVPAQALPWQLVAVPALTIVSVAGALLLRGALEGVGLQILYVLPRSVIPAAPRLPGGLANLIGFGTSPQTADKR